MAKIGLPLDKLPICNYKGKRDLNFLEDMQAYMYTHTSCGIFINIQNEKRKKEIKNRLIMEINELRDETGQNFVKAIPKEDLYPRTNELTFPDIILEFKNGYTPSEFIVPPFIIRKKSYILPQDLAPIFRIGTHDSKGIILLFGETIKKLRIRARVEDVLPTVLYLLKIPIPSYVDGKVILDAFSEYYKEKNKPRFITEDRYIKQAIKRIKDKFKGIYK